MNTLLKKVITLFTLSTIVLSTTKVDAQLYSGICDVTNRALMKQHKPYAGFKALEYDMINEAMKTATVEHEKKESVESNGECARFSEHDIHLMTLIMIAEAEGESECGKRLVVDTILNRLDSSDFPNTVSEVVYEPTQFTSVWNGRCDSISLTDDDYELVRDEIQQRLNKDVIYFTANHYGKFGHPLFVERNHYFSSK